MFHRTYFLFFVLISFLVLLVLLVLIFVRKCSLQNVFSLSKCRWLLLVVEPYADDYGDGIDFCLFFWTRLHKMGGKH